MGGKGKRRVKWKDCVSVSRAGVIVAELAVIIICCNETKGEGNTKVNLILFNILYFSYEIYTYKCPCFTDSPVRSSVGQEPSSQARQVYSSNTNSFSLQGVHVQQQLTSPLRITWKRRNTLCLCIFPYLLGFHLSTLQIMCSSHCIYGKLYF